MNEHDFDRRHKSLATHKLLHNSDDKIHYLLAAEAELLRSISSRAPLPRLLNGICIALDRQIGNVVSLISLDGAAAMDPAEVARNARLFGLYAFCSQGVVADNGQLLGSLSMFCCIPRGPSTREFQLIERATCLAAVAINRHNLAYRESVGVTKRNPPVRARLLQWPVSTN